MTPEEIENEFESTYTKMIEHVASFNEERFNLKPGPEKWSAGQIARHLVKGNATLSELLEGKTEETKREPDEMVEKIKGVFLNFESPLKSPDFIVPEEKHYQRPLMIDSLEKIKSGIAEAAKNADLTKTCLDFEFPVFGHLTGLEALAFAVFHTQRHIWQLERLSRQV